MIVKALKIKLIIIAFLIFISYSQDCDSTKYDKFLEFFGIPKPQAQQYQMRVNIYCQRYRNILETNSLDLGYQVKQYKWMDRKDQQLQSLINVSKVPKVALKVGLPQSIDYRTTNDVSKIKDQGYCGSCWVFGNVGLYQSWMMFKGQKQYDLSEEYVLQCTNPYTKYVMKSDYDSSCNGGYPYYSGHLLRATGAPLQSQYPYVSYYEATNYKNTKGICQVNKTLVFGGDPQLTKFQYFQGLTDDQLKQLLTQGPVAAQMYSNKGFLSYSSGVYSGCPSNSVSAFYRNHYVIIVGYDSDGNWIIKNSWGKSWGQQGFATISKDADCALKFRVYRFYSDQTAGKSLVYQREITYTNSQLLGNYLKSQFVALILIFSMLISFYG